MTTICISIYYRLLPQTVTKENIHSFSKYFLNLYYVPGTIPGAGGYISKEKDTCPHAAYSFIYREKKMNQINYLVY